MKFVGEFDNLSRDRRLLLQAELRIAYDKISSLVTVPTGLDYDQPADILVNAIAAARIYFWIRTFEDEGTLDGLTAAELRDQLQDEGITRSTAAALGEVLKRLLDGEGVSDWTLEQSRKDVIATMAQARELLLELLPD